MEKDLAGKVREYMIARQMVPDGARIVVGLSGGADSMCLIEVMRQIGRWELEAVHVHHGLRENADGDLAFVRRWCEKREIPLTCRRVDAAAFAGQTGMGIEEAARALRYEAFSECLRDAAQRSGMPCVLAVAHHMQDQAETVLFHIVRGSRLPGLSGIRPVTKMGDMTVIRPLLACSRREIEDYLTAGKVPWREDETNTDVRYSRNILRQEVMPLLSRINPQAQQHIAALAEEVDETDAFLCDLTREAAERCMAEQGGDGVKISISRLLREPPVLQRRILHSQIAKTAGTAKDLQALHIQAVLKMAGQDGSGELHLPGDVRAVKRYDILHLFKAIGESRDTADAAHGIWPLSEEEYTAQILTPEAPLASIPQKKYTKWFDYDKISSFPQYRKRQPGDRITLSESGASKKIARYMIDAKVPREYRDIIVLPVFEKEVLWIPGGRISAAYMVSAGTRRVLELKWIPGSSLEDG